MRPKLLRLRTLMQTKETANNPNGAVAFGPAAEDPPRQGGPSMMMASRQNFEKQNPDWPTKDLPTETQGNTRGLHILDPALHQSSG